MPPRKAPPKAGDAQAPRLRANGAAIQALRLARGMSLRDVHILTGLDRGYLSRLERGLAGAKPDTIARCAAALAVPIAAITHDR